MRALWPWQSLLALCSPGWSLACAVPGSGVPGVGPGVVGDDPKPFLSFSKRPNDLSVSRAPLTSGQVTETDRLFPFEVDGTEATICVFPPASYPWCPRSVVLVLDYRRLRPAAHTWGRHWLRDVPLVRKCVASLWPQSRGISLAIARFCRVEVVRAHSSTFRTQVFCYPCVARRRLVRVGPHLVIS